MQQMTKAGGGASAPAYSEVERLRLIKRSLSTMARVERVEEALLKSWHVDAAPALQVRGSLSGVKVA